MVAEEVTPKEAAKRLGVSRRLIYDLIECGRLRAIPRRSITGERRFWLIPMGEIEKLERAKKLAEKANESEFKNRARFR